MCALERSLLRTLSSSILISDAPRPTHRPHTHPSSCYPHLCGCRLRAPLQPPGPLCYSKLSGVAARFAPIPHRPHSDIAVALPLVVGSTRASQQPIVVGASPNLATLRSRFGHARQVQAPLGMLGGSHKSSTESEAWSRGEETGQKGEREVRRCATASWMRLPWRRRQRARCL
eukprot:scaffold1105_cov140-Isochrysis_galbana.AAC.12